MAEIEIHHAHEPHDDPTGRRVGVLVGVIGILLAIVTIASHREHTAAVVHKSAANDHWVYYQAKKVREHTSEVGGELVLALGADPAKAAAVVGVVLGALGFLYGRAARQRSSFASPPSDCQPRYSVTSQPATPIATSHAG